ncbi:hypothetical protein BDV32DRAFT_140776 [Aspergillus pseudonomiae]|uniref:Caspase domain-containing protein n=1 Tax=Aspergillus pseudonomiae TaxID=1506151 RepID=A0A5N7D2V3_9EURO|nr:uncharacterized protein BDV37DRAFT_274231 [Aspergillus pseudonomiae]KAB8257009.1 hypothetical protein BDV32DRAFT_140776 [Aspergillus pseudonomiae]KAE8400742.1 hypothetical protein BDV37DRAFT_274231 [Aspergillus pseudonomiae]
MSALLSPGDALALENFEPLMEKLVDQHRRQMTIPINACTDLANFQAILRLFDYPKAEEYVIPVDADASGWDVADRIRGLIRQAMIMTGRTIILIHYGGHGLNWNDELHVCNSTGRKLFSVNRNMLDLVDSKSVVTDSHNIDLVFIFDSCYSYLVTREYTGHDRVVEILAAVDEDSRLAFSPGLRAAFTGKLYTEILRREQSGAQDIELAELIAYLHRKSPVKKPAHRLLVGANSLRLSISGDTERIYAPPGPATYAMFSFRLVKSLFIDQIADFCDWILKLPREIGLKLEAAYETQSMTLIFRAPYAFWLKLNGYKFVQLICEAKSENLLLSIPTSSTYAYHA